VPAAVDALAGRRFAQVNLLAEDADRFAQCWQSRTGAAANTGMRTRLYRLGTLTPPAAPPGRARAARASDRELVLRWRVAFLREIGIPSNGVVATVDDQLACGAVTLWEVDGAPVSMAARSCTESGMVRIQGVYTPPELRGRGYAGATTTAVTRAALAAGTGEIVLVTDLSNPTSNALYQRLGYRPVEDRTVMEFV